MPREVLTATLAQMRVILARLIRYLVRTGMIGQTGTKHSACRNCIHNVKTYSVCR